MFLFVFILFILFCFVWNQNETGLLTTINGSLKNVFFVRYDVFRTPRVVMDIFKTSYVIDIRRTFLVYLINKKYMARYAWWLMSFKHHFACDVIKISLEKSWTSDWKKLCVMNQIISFANYRWFWVRRLYVLDDLLSVTLKNESYRKFL